MSDLQALVRKVLLNHIGGWIDNGGDDTHCLCGHRGQWGELHCDHVAEAVVAALPQPDLDTVAAAIRIADTRPRLANFGAYYRRLARAAIDAGVGR